MIPPPDGFEVCRRMREEGRWEPVQLVTARDAVPDRVRGLTPVRTTTCSSRSRSLGRLGEVLTPSDLLDDVWDLALDGPELFGTYVREKVDRPFARQNIQEIPELGAHRFDPEG